ncbi:MAG: hypothetical protein ACTHQE_06645, partial [Thermomicrobiales bacterium]
MAQQTTVPGAEVAETPASVLGDAGSSLVARLGRGLGVGKSDDHARDVSAGPDEPRPQSFMRQAGIGLTRLGVAATALLLIAAVGLFAFRSLYSDRIYPAVVVGDVQVGGLTPSQATEKVAARADQLEGSLVSFR